MVGMLLGEPDVLMLFGAVGGVMVGAVFYFGSPALSAFCLAADETRPGQHAYGHE